MLSKLFSPCMILTATSGLHRGNLAQVTGHVSIGSDTDNTVRLLDRDAEGHNADLHISRFGVKVVPRGGDILLNGIPCIKPQQVWFARAKSVTLDIGPVGTVLRRNSRSLPLRTIPAFVGVMAFLVVGITVPGHLIWAAPSSTVAEDALRIETYKQHTDPATEANSITNDLVAAKLESLDLSDFITINFDVAEASLVAAGNVDAEQMIRYRSFLRWYDGIPGRPVIRSIVTEAAPAIPDLPAISMIYLAPRRQIIDFAGVAYDIGDDLPGGWKIVDITDEFFTVINDGYVHVVSINGGGVTP